jgi:hypothetical protein
MTTLTTMIKTLLVEPWDNFFHERTSNLTVAANIRTAYAVVAFCNVYLLSLDWHSFFRHVLPTKIARQTIDPDTWTIFDLLDIPDEFLRYFLYLWMAHLVLLGLGIFPRLQAACVFFWINQFMAQNNQLWNGEDNVTRLCAFFLIFWPPSRSSSTTTATATAIKSWPMWPFRLMQIQLCLVFFSSGGLKQIGASWRDGTALYRVVQHDALYGGYFNPEWIFGYDRPLMFLTYATQVLEMGSIVTLWFRETRWPTLLSIWLFHFTIDATMNLNSFHWIMMVGWSSFLIQPDDVSKQWSLRGIYQRLLLLVVVGGTTDPSNQEDEGEGEKKKKQ